MKNIVKFLAFSLFGFTFPHLFAAPAPVPKEALKAFQIAKGRPCKAGVVFMDGKYLPPPYVVKRYGTAIMINDIQVTAPLVAWEDFVKTQSGVQVTRTEAAPAPDVSAPAPAPAPVETPVVQSSSDDDPLADLFDDDPKPAKKITVENKPAVRKTPPKPTVTTTYALQGDFVANDASRALLEKINSYRTDVNARLLKGGFVFFGSNYSQVSGESREAKRLVEALPTIMRNSSDETELYAELRRNGFPYLTEPIAKDLFRNKHLYPQIEARARQIAEQDRLNGLMRGTIR